MYVRALVFVHMDSTFDAYNVPTSDALSSREMHDND